MSVYADTSFLLSYFGQDSNTLPAHRYAAAWIQPPRIAWTPFGQLEFNNAARALIFSGKLDLTRWHAIQLRVKEDLRNGILTARALPVYRHYEAAENISSAHTVRNGARTLDVLHVAAASVLGAKEFLSFDLRQRQLAAHCGLKILPSNA